MLYNHSKLPKNQFEFENGRRHFGLNLLIPRYRIYILNTQNKNADSHSQGLSIENCDTLLESWFHADVWNKKICRGQMIRKFFTGRSLLPFKKLLIQLQYMRNKDGDTNFRFTAIKKSLDIKLFSMFERTSEPIYTMSRLTCTYLWSHSSSSSFFEKFQDFRCHGFPSYAKKELVVWRQSSGELNQNPSNLKIYTFHT